MGFDHDEMYRLHEILAECATLLPGAVTSMLEDVRRSREPRP
jgi:hypothetical protein